MNHFNDLKRWICEQLVDITGVIYHGNSIIFILMSLYIFEMFLKLLKQDDTIS